MKPTNIMIIQAIQLPVVLGIFYFTFKSTIANGIETTTFDIARKLKGNLEPGKPLLYLSLGFICNLVYLLLSMQDISVADEQSQAVTQQSWPILLMRALTTSFFLMQVIPNLRLETEPSVATTSRRLSPTWERVVILLIGLGLMELYPLSFITSLIFHSFELLGNLLVCLYLFKLVSVHPPTRQNKFVRFAILAGWMIWTALQAWRPSGLVLLDGNSIPVDLAGFSLSLFAKGLVLIGLIELSVSISNHINRELDTKVLEVTGTKVRFETLNTALSAKNEQLERTLESLESLQEVINSVSNCNNLEELSFTVVDHLTNGIVFDFDYAIFSEVNYLEQRIVYRHSLSKHDQIIQPQQWVRTEGFPFDHHDIMAKVVRDGEVCHAKGDRLNGKLVDLESTLSPLDHKTFVKFAHQHLNRFWVPLKNLKDTGTNKARVVAVIEVGYYIGDLSNLDESHKNAKGIEKIRELNLYIDNCAQSYERLFGFFLDLRVAELLKQSSEISKDDHNRFLREVLESTRRLINADFGLIWLNSTESIFWNALKVFGRGDQPLVELWVRHYVESNPPSSGECGSISEALPLDVSLPASVKSMAVSRVLLKEDLFGYLFMFSANESHFNPIVASIIAKVAKGIAIRYTEKKFHNGVSSLIRPDNAITDLEANLQPLFGALKNYFETSHISIWLKESKFDERGNFLNAVYVQKFASDELKAGCRSFNNMIKEGEITFDDDYELLSLDERSGDETRVLFEEYGERNGMKLLLRKVLKSENQTLGFIHIYFPQTINNLTYEDENFLDLVKVKVLLSVQIHSLLSAFSDISLSFTQNDLKVTLKAITNAAMTLLNADPVVLFKSNNGKDVFCSDVMYSKKADFNEKGIEELFETEKDSHVIFAEQIIKGGTKYFRNKDEYRQFVRRNPRIPEIRSFEQDFWEREGIRSLAAIRLAHGTTKSAQPVGVMFVNFRNEIDFEIEEVKGLINTFASLASVSIYNGLISEKHRKFVLSNIRLTKPMISEAIKSGALHDVKKRLEPVITTCTNLIKRLNDPLQYRDISLKDIKGPLTRLEKPIKLTKAAFDEIEQLYKPSDAPIILEQVNLYRLVSEQLDFMALEMDQQLIVHSLICEDRGIQIDCDESQLSVAILNLLKNSIQAIEKRGEIKVEIQKIAPNRVKVEVIDNGKGISEDVKDSLFQFYVTDGKSDGSGLGLPMTKYIIEENHLGKISGRTKNGVTTFTIELPITYYGSSPTYSTGE